MKINDLIFGNTEFSKECEDNLWDEFRKMPEDSDTLKRLVEYYLPLVVKVANKLPNNIREKVSVRELIGAGVIGLHDAIGGFACDKNVQFSTFAYKRIKGAILDDLRSQDPLTRTQRTCYKDICAAINKLTSEFARPPTDEEIAKETGMTLADVDKYIGMGSQIINLEDEFEDGLSYMDVLADNETPSPFDSAHSSLALLRLREHFRELDVREQKVLFLRHYEDMSVKEIAKVLEISEGRISQIYQKVVLKLRAMMKTEELI
ncbi:MAG: hypothetical protein A2020_06400 [Lentisphaerae bacterium GWF2_45_14]|nr:MAG: hypothetical protein A2020_06400 [Lentisphaerae bacterium GWF2_45_14]